MAITQNTYTGNGSTVLYSFTFPYLETTDIKVSLNGVNTTAYTLANPTTVQFNSAPANGVAIRIYRQTDDAATKATFFPGSAIRSQDLNDNFLQVLYKSQETETFASSTDASAIQATANTALNNSTTAITTANAASATANGIASTANTALSNSNAAVSTANTASSNASSALSVANAALPKAGGTMTGNIIFNAGQTFPDVLPITGGSLTGNVSTTGTLTDAKGDVRDIPQNSQTSAYTLVADDAGKHISITTGGVTVPTAVFGIGDAITIYNNSANNQTITQGASTTLRQAGTASTGNRTLAQYGVATILCVASNTFVISGAGLT